MTEAVLVTGGAGFIGSHLVDLLLREARDMHVVVLDALTYAGSLDNLAIARSSERLHFREGDIINRRQVERVFREFQFSAVFHLAAESHVDRSIEGPREFVSTNVAGTLELLEAARGYWSQLEGAAKRDFRFVHVSTDEVYGSMPGGVEATEESVYQPNSPYSASKAASDHFARAYHVTYGLPTVTTHCTNNYGPRQYAEKLIPVVITRALAGQTIPVYGDGQHSRDWLYVTDHCRGLVQAWRKGTPGQTYNFSASCELTTKEMVEAAIDELDRQAPRGLNEGSYRALVDHVRDRLGHDRRYAVSSGKARDELGWAPSTFLAEGLCSTVAWYLDEARKAMKNP